MIKNKIALALSLSFIALVGCSGNQDLYAPVSEPHVQNSFDVEEIFSTSSAGVDKFYSQIKPAFVDKTFYVSSRKGLVYAKDVMTGKTLWRVDIGNEDENDDKRSSRLSASLAANITYVAVGSENGYIYVLDANDGHIVWKKYLGGEVVAAPAFSKSGTSLFVQDTRGRLFNLDSATGEERWVAAESPSSLRLRSQSSFIVVGDEYLVTGQSGGKVAVYLQSTGAVVNEINISTPYGVNDLERIADVSSTPLILGSNLYATSYNGSLTIFSFDENKIIGKFGYSSSQNMDFDENYIVLTDDKGHVYCIDRISNAELWSNTQLTYRKTSAPVIYGGYVVVGDLDGYLYFMSLATGDIKSMVKVDNSAINSSPVVYNGKLYVFANDGSIICIKYDPAGIASAKEATTAIEREYAGAGVNLMAPGVGDSGIYAPDAIDAASLKARREAIIKAVAEAERRQKAAENAQRRAYEKARAEYEARIKAYENERRQRLSGFGLMPQEGIKSDSSAQVDEGYVEDTAKPLTTDNENTAPDTTKSEDVKAQKATGFGL